MKKNIAYKALSIAIVFVFLANTVCLSAPHSVYDVRVSSEAGKVISRWKAAIDKDSGTVHSDKLVYLLEDAHDNYSAQENIAHIVRDFLPDDTNTSVLLAVEGAHGNISYSDLQSYPLVSARESASRSLMRQGYLTGVEQAVISSGKKIDLFGVEDSSVFIENYQAFYSLQKAQPNIQAELERRDAIIESLKATFNPELKEIDEAYRAFTAKEETITNYLQQVLDRSQQVYSDQSVYPNIALFIEIAHEESTLARDTLEQEITNAAERVNYEMGDNAHITDATLLMLYAHIQSADDTHKFPQLEKKISVIRKFALLDFQAFEQEVEELSYAARMHYADTEEEREVITCEYIFAFVKRIVMLQATRLDVSRLKELCPGNGGVILESASLKAINDEAGTHEVLNEYLDQAYAFYSVAEKREKFMLANLLHEMDEQDSSVAVFVVGGYHTPGIAHALRDASIQYCIIRPHVDALSKKTGFLDRMMGNLIPLAPQYISYVTNHYITGLVQMLSEEYGEAIIREKFDGAWTNEVVHNNDLASLLMCLKDIEGVPDQVQARAQALYAAAQSVAIELENADYANSDPDSLFLQVKEIVQQKKMIDDVVLALNLARPTTGDLPQIGKEARVAAVYTDKAGNYLAQVVDVKTDENIKPPMLLTPIKAKNPFRTGFSKLPENPIVRAFALAAQTKDEAALPRVYTFNEDIRDLTGFSWEKENIIALDETLYKNRDARPMLLFHELGHYLIDRQKAGKKGNGLELECKEENGTVRLFVKIRHRIVKKKMPIETTQTMPLTLSPATLDYIYQEKGNNELGWVEWQTDSHYLLRVLQYEIFRKEKQEDISSFDNYETLFTQQIRDNFYKRQIRRRTKIQQRTKKLLRQIKKSDSVKWKKLIPDLEKSIEDTNNDLNALAEKIIIKDEKDEELKEKGPSKAELHKEGIDLCEPKKVPLRPIEEVVYELEMQQELLDVYRHVQLQNGVENKELLQENVIIDSLGLVLRNLKKEMSNGNDRLDEIMQIKSPERKMKIAKEVVKKNDISPKLNFSQNASMNMMVHASLSVTHGPAACGKTETINEAVKNILMRNGPNPVLVVSPQHKSTDEITERLFNDAEKIPVSRLGYDPGSFTDFVRRNCTVQWEEGMGRKNFDERWDDWNLEKGSNRCVYTATHMGATFYWRKLVPDERAQRRLNNVTLVIDEGALINYADLLVLIQNVKPRAVHIIGDHRQFTPYPLMAKLRGKARDDFEKALTPELRVALERYQTSVFSDLINLPIYKTHLLTNYRNHKLIVQLINYFYEGIELKAFHDEPVEQDTFEIEDTSELEQPAYEKRVVNTVEEKTIEGDSTPAKGKREVSFVNKYEARRIVQKIHEFLKKRKTANNKIYRAGNISVITPYQAQADLIQQLIEEDIGFDHNQKKALIENISTLRKIQGGENEITLLSLVRSDMPEPPADLLADLRQGYGHGRPRRGLVGDPSLLLVALSRMKKKLYVIGNRRVLNEYVEKSPNAMTRGMYNHLFDFAQVSKNEVEKEEAMRRQKEEELRGKPKPLQAGDFACSISALQKIFKAGRIRIEKTMKERFTLPSPKKAKVNIVTVKTDEKPLTFYKRRAKGRAGVIWAITEADRDTFLSMIELPLKEKDASDAVVPVADTDVGMDTDREEEVLLPDLDVEEVTETDGVEQLLVAPEANEMSCASGNLQKKFRGGWSKIEKTFYSKFLIPRAKDAVDMSMTVNDYEHPITFYRRKFRGQIIWCIKTVDFPLFAKVMGLTLYEPIHVVESVPVEEFFIEDAPPVIQYEAIAGGTSLQSMNESEYDFGLREGFGFNTDDPLFMSLGRLLSDEMHQLVALLVSDTLVRMDSGSLEMMYRTGVLTEKERDIFAEHAIYKFRRYSKENKKDLALRLSKLIREYEEELSDDDVAMMCELLLPLNIVDFVAATHDQTRESAIATLFDYPEYATFTPDELEKTVEEFRIEFDDDARKIGKEVEPEISTFRRSLTENKIKKKQPTASIKIYDYETSNVFTLEMKKKDVPDAATLITGDGLRGPIGMRVFVHRLLALFIDAYTHGDIEMYTFGRERVEIRDLFGFAFSKRKGVKHDVLAIYEEFATNRVAMFHEIAEYMVKRDTSLLEEMELLLDEESQSWVTRHVRRSIAESRESHFLEHRIHAHYVIRALSRELFRSEDSQLTCMIKEDKKRVASLERQVFDIDTSTIASHELPEGIIRGPYMIDGHKILIEDVNIEEIDALLDEWFSSGSKRYFGRAYWEERIQGNRANGWKTYLEKVTDELGRIVGIAYYHKQPFGYDGIERITYVGDLREVDAAWRGKKIGEFMLAKTLFRAVYDNTISDDVFILHPAEDLEYAPQGRRAKDFYEIHGFRQLYLLAQDPVLMKEEDFEADDYMAITRERALQVIDSALLKAGHLQPPPPKQLELFPLIEEKAPALEATIGGEVDTFLGKIDSMEKRDEEGFETLLFDLKDAEGRDFPVVLKVFKDACDLNKVKERVVFVKEHLGSSFVPFTMLENVTILGEEYELALVEQKLVPFRHNFPKNVITTKGDRVDVHSQLKTVIMERVKKGIYNENSFLPKNFGYDPETGTVYCLDIGQMFFGEKTDPSIFIHDPALFKWYVGIDNGFAYAEHVANLKLFDTLDIPSDLSLLELWGTEREFTQPVPDVQLGAAPVLSSPEEYMTLDEAYAFLNKKRSAILHSDDLERSRSVVEKMLQQKDPSIEKVLVVGNSLENVPVLLALMGKNVTYLDDEHPHGSTLYLKKMSVEIDLREDGYTQKFPLQLINNVFFGGLDYEKTGLERHSYDCVIMLDLVVGVPQQAKNFAFETWRLLKQDGYLIYDISYNDVIGAVLEGCFTQKEMISIFPMGTYPSDGNAFVKLVDSGRAREDQAARDVIFPNFSWVFEEGTYRSQYPELVKKVFEKIKYTHYNALQTLVENGVNGITIRRESDTVDRIVDGKIVLSETLLAKCLVYGVEGARAQQELEEWIMPEALYRESIAMSGISKQALDTFGENQNIYTEQKKVSLAAKQALSALSEFGVWQYKAQYIEELYWRWMYKIAHSFAGTQASESFVRKMFFQTIEDMTHESMSDPVLQEVVSLFASLAQEEPALLWDSMIEPLGFIKAFVDAQSLDGALQGTTSIAIEKGLTEEERKALRSIDEKINAVVADEKSLVVYIDDEIENSRLSVSVREMIDAKHEKYQSQGNDMQVHVRLLSERTASVGQPELILAFEDTSVDAVNVYRFSRDIDDFAFDVYLFGLFFDVLVYKGFVYNGNIAGDTQLFAQIGNIEFHATMKKHFDDSVLEHIRERVVRSAA